MYFDISKLLLSKHTGPRKRVFERRNRAIKGFLQFHCLSLRAEVGPSWMIGHVMGRGSVSGGWGRGPGPPAQPVKSWSSFIRVPSVQTTAPLPFTPVRVNVSPIRLPVPGSARRLALMKSPLLFAL